MAARTRKRKRTRSKAPDLEQRLIWLIGIWLVLITIIVGRLVFVQALEHSRYSEVARTYLENRREVPPTRGSLLDRNGQVLALDLVYYSLAVRLNQVENRADMFRKLGGPIKVSAADLQKRVKGKKSFVYLAHRLGGEVADEIRDLKLRGVVLEKKISRYYPYGSIGAQLLGYCDFDNVARGGLELEYDRQLKGQPGWSIYLRDALGNQFPNLDFPGAAPRNGYSVETTIDMVYQSILEDELARAVKEFSANNAAAVLLDPRSGEVLGMANYPEFDPNHYNRYPIENYRNRAVTDVYEPGSTYKMVALAMAIGELGVNLDKDLLYCENGKYRLADKMIRDHKPFGYLTVRKAFENSSNIGMIKLAERFEAPVFYRYSRDFGFGSKTGIGLPAEASGILHKPASFSSTTVRYMSFGYEVAATPLQLAAAYSAVANNGKLMQPFVVRRLLDDGGQVVEERQPRVIRQVVSVAVAESMKNVLYGVVENGTGNNAKLPGLSIAGKTGTAQKVDVRTSSHTSDQHVSSFIGFFPVEAPRFVLLVMVNNPQGAYYGSQVAAPAFRNIAERIVGLPLEDQRREMQLARAEIPVHNNYPVAVEGMTIERAISYLDKRGISYRVVGNGTLVVRQEPPAHQSFAGVDQLVLFTETRQAAAQHIMPRLVGLSMKEALQIMGQWEIPVEVEGNGIVVDQLPAAGKQIIPKTRIKLVCQPT